MAKIFHDSVAQTSNSTGTGDFTLSASTPFVGRRTLQSVPGLQINDVFQYRIAAIDENGIETGQWETGLGRYVSANVMRRDIPDAGSSASLPVNFNTGTKKFSLTVNAEDLRDLSLMLAGGEINRNPDETIANVVSNGITFTFNYTLVDGLPQLATISGDGRVWTYVRTETGLLQRVTVTTA